MVTTKFISCVGQCTPARRAGGHEEDWCLGKRAKTNARVKVTSICLGAPDPVKKGASVPLSVTDLKRLRMEKGTKKKGRGGRE